MRIGEEMDFSRIALKHTFIQHSWQGKIFRPNPDAFNNIKVARLRKSPARLTQSIKSCAVRKHTIAHFTNKPIQVQYSEARANEWLVYQVISTLKSCDLGCATCYFQCVF